MVAGLRGLGPHHLVPHYKKRQDKSREMGGEDDILAPYLVQFQDIVPCKWNFARQRDIEFFNIRFFQLVLKSHFYFYFLQKIFRTSMKLLSNDNYITFEENVESDYLREWNLWWMQTGFCPDTSKSYLSEKRVIRLSDKNTIYLIQFL